MTVEGPDTAAEAARVVVPSAAVAWVVETPELQRVTSRAAGTAAAAFVGPCSSADAASVGKGPSLLRQRLSLLLR